MRNSAKRVWLWLEEFRNRSAVPLKTAREKKSRPMWVARLMASSADLGFFSMIFYCAASLIGLRGSPAAPLIMVMAFPVYYMLTEMFLGISPGKILMSCKMAVPNPTRSRASLLLRGVLRFIPAINLFLLLSWRRVTLLDLLSGTRVRLSRPPEKATVKSTSTSASRRLLGKPRGFNPKDLKR